MKRAMLILLLACCGCDKTNEETYTVTTIDGKEFRGMRHVWIGDTYVKFAGPDGRHLYVAGTHYAVEEVAAEKGGE